MIIFLLNIFTGIAGAQPQKNPIAWVKSPLEAAFERKIGASRDSNIKQFKMFEEMAVAQGYQVVSSGLFEDKANFQMGFCGESTLGDCDTRPFRYQKKMVKNQEIYYLAAEGQLIVKASDKSLINVEMEYQGLSRMNRDLTPVREEP